MATPIREPDTTEYEVRVSNIFEAETPQDAVLQMAEWLAENARFAGYRVIDQDTGASEFYDAEKIYDV